MKRYYGVTPSQADRALWLVTSVTVFFVVLAGVRGEWIKALLYLIVAFAILVAQRLRGPFAGKPLLELSGSELIVRQPSYMPTRVQKVQVDQLRRLTIVGSCGDRRFRFSFLDGSKLELRPHFLEAEEGAIGFIKANLAGVHVVERDFPGILEKIRGDY